MGPQNCRRFRTPNPGSDYGNRNYYYNRQVKLKFRERTTYLKPKGLQGSNADPCDETPENEGPQATHPGLAVAPSTSEISLGGSDTHRAVLTEGAVSVNPQSMGRVRRLTIHIPQTRWQGRRRRLHNEGGVEGRAAQCFRSGRGEDSKPSVT